MSWMDLFRVGEWLSPGQSQSKLILGLLCEFLRRDISVFTLDSTWANPEAGGSAAIWLLHCIRRGSELPTAEPSCPKYLLLFPTWDFYTVAPLIVLTGWLTFASWVWAEAMCLTSKHRCEEPACRVLLWCFPFVMSTAVPQREVGLSLTGKTTCYRTAANLCRNSSEK